MSKITHSLRDSLLKSGEKIVKDMKNMNGIVQNDITITKDILEYFNGLIQKIIIDLQKYAEEMNSSITF